MTVSRSALVVLLLLIVSCGGGGGGAPASPSRPAANVSIGNVDVSATRDVGGIQYTVKFTVREIGGVTAATLAGVEIAFFTDAAQIGVASATAADVFGGTLLVANGSMDSRAIAATDTSGQAVRRLEVRVTFTDANGTSGRATQSVDAPSVRHPPVIVEFSADQTSFARGRSTTLHWNVTGATRVTLEPPYTDVPAAGTLVVTPTFTTTYRLASTNGDGNTEQRLTITVIWPAVEYQVVGTTSRINVITYANSNEGTSQVTNVTPPWAYSFSASSGQFLYVSAQNGLASGCIETRIYKRGDLYKNSVSCGAYVIATSSGTF